VNNTHLRDVFVDEYLRLDRNMSGADRSRYMDVCMDGYRLTGKRPEAITVERVLSRRAVYMRAYMRERRRVKECHIEYDNGPWWRATGPDSVHSLVSDDQPEETDYDINVTSDVT
jgi:hypothetical protein